MDSEIVIVSGLPRSGTSLMMQMLDAGGVEVVTDNIRTADTDNPRGYYELEKVKAVKRDASWLPEARGKAVKMVSKLLYDLPRGEKYRLIFMQRELEEILVSQEKMLERLGRTGLPREEMAQLYRLHLDRLHEWLGKQSNMAILHVRYNELIAQPAEQASRLVTYLARPLNIVRMVTAVDPSLYRNRVSLRDATDITAAHGPADETAKKAGKQQKSKSERANKPVEIDGKVVDND